MQTKEELKSSSLNPTDEKVDNFDMSADEAKAFSNLLVRLQRARDARNQPYPMFGNQPYIKFYEENRKKAHTILPAKKNESDVIISAGTLENKLEAVLSNVTNLNLSPEIKAFDDENNIDILSGLALQDTIAFTEELDDDEEKKMLRQKEMLIQGTVFVEEKWLTKYKKKRRLNREFNGITKGLEISTELVKYFEGPSRRVLSGPSVYLGDITEFFMKNQPFIFTCEILNYEQIEGMFRNWDRWQYVSRKLRSLNVESNVSDTTSDNTLTKWTLNNIGMDQVEMIVYQSKPEDEFQIILNGIPMLPIGFPLSVFSPAGEYTIEKQTLKSIDNFAYGRGFIQSAEKASELLDEMLRLAVLKTRKSFTPPYINTSKRVISPRVLNPGQITQGGGLMADSLIAIGNEGQGVTPSEFQIIRELTDRIDKQTVSQTFAGQQGKSGTTATEVLELQRQAKVTLGLIVFCCAMLEKKIAYLRLYNLLENFYRPIAYVNVEGQEIPKYRKVVTKQNIEKEGMGERQIIPSMELPMPEEIRYMELEEEKIKGFPVRKIFMNPNEIKEKINTWYIVVTPKEKDTSSTNKLLFREEIQDLLSMTQFGSVPNKEGLEDEYARVWGKDKTKMFTAKPIQAPMEQVDEIGMDGNTKGRPNIKGMSNMNNINAGE